MKYVWICHQTDSSDLFRGYGPTFPGGLINWATFVGWWCPSGAWSSKVRRRGGGGGVSKVWQYIEQWLQSCRIYINQQHIISTHPWKKEKSWCEEFRFAWRCTSWKGNELSEEYNRRLAFFNIKMNRRKLAKMVMSSIISPIYDPQRFSSIFVLEGRHLLQILCYHDVQWNENFGKDLEK